VSSQVSPAPPTSQNGRGLVDQLAESSVLSAECCRFNSGRAHIWKVDRVTFLASSLRGEADSDDQADSRPAV
jgi:hypothetical protein